MKDGTKRNFTPEQLQVLYNLPSDAPKVDGKRYLALRETYEKKFAGRCVDISCAAAKPTGLATLDAGLSDDEMAAAHCFDELIYALTWNFSPFVAHHETATLDYLCEVADLLSERSNAWLHASGREEAPVARPLKDRRDALLSYKAATCAAFVLLELSTSGCPGVLEDLRQLSGALAGEAFHRWYRRPGHVRHEI